MPSLEAAKLTVHIDARRAEQRIRLLQRVLGYAPATARILNRPWCTRLLERWIVAGVSMRPDAR